MWIIKDKAIEFYYTFLQFEIRYCTGSQIVYDVCYLRLIIWRFLLLLRCCSLLTWWMIRIAVASVLRQLFFSFLRRGPNKRTIASKLRTYYVRTNFPNCYLNFELKVFWKYLNGSAIIVRLWLQISKNVSWETELKRCYSEIMQYFQAFRDASKRPENAFWNYSYLRR